MNSADVRTLGSGCRVSFVVTSRNDDHGGRMLRRFEIFADALLEQASRHGLVGELIVVEWNPPPGPRLHEVLKLRNTSDTFVVRFIEVPSDAHQSIRNSDTIPLFQMIAKNVGIRRAQGEFVVATNPDVLFSDALISFLATGDLKPHTMYRLDRHDVEAGVPEDVGVGEQLRWCAQHVLRIHRRDGTFEPTKNGILRRLWRSGQMRAPALREFYRDSARKVSRRLHGWRPWQLRRTLEIVQSILLRTKRAVQPRAMRTAMTRARLLYGPRRVFHNALWLGLSAIGPPPVHTNGCGDFTMLARDRWVQLRAYPELPLWSMHIDSFLCYMAVVSGLRERVLRRPCAMFHMEHERSWVVMKPEERLRTFALKPWLDINLLGSLWEEAYRTRRPLIFNDERWGLADWGFEEVRVVSGERQVIKPGSRLIPIGEER